MRSRRNRLLILGVLLSVGLGLSTAAYAGEDVRGVITARGRDGTLMVRTDDLSSLIVVLDDATSVKRTDRLREMKFSSASLIPGLRVQLEGTFLAADRFAAKRVKVSRSDLKMALAITGGVEPSDLRSLENQKRIEQNAKMIARQQQALQRQGLRIATMTVYFKNGSDSIGRYQKAELEQLAQRARAMRGLVIQVEGHASAVGSEARNQRLSMQRAHAVAAVLSQNGIAPTQMLVPATMGLSSQIDDNTTSEGLPENRRVVVTVLQNKAIAQSTANPGSTTVERLER